MRNTIRLKMTYDEVRNSAWFLGVETNIANWQRKQNMNNNYSAVERRTT